MGEEASNTEKMSENEMKKVNKHLINKRNAITAEKNNYYRIKKRIKSWAKAGKI